MGVRDPLVLSVAQLLQLNMGKYLPDGFDLLTIEGDGATHARFSIPATALAQVGAFAILSAMEATITRELHLYYVNAHVQFQLDQSALQTAPEVIKGSLHIRRHLEGGLTLEMTLDTAPQGARALASLVCCYELLGRFSLYEMARRLRAGLTHRLAANAHSVMGYPAWTVAGLVQGAVQAACKTVAQEVGQMLEVASVSLLVHKLVIAATPLDFNAERVVTGSRDLLAFACAVNECSPVAQLTLALKPISCLQIVGLR